MNREYLTQKFNEIHDKQAINSQNTIKTLREETTKRINNTMKEYTYQSFLATDFDNGEVIAENKEDARRLAIEEVRKVIDEINKKTNHRCYIEDIVVKESALSIHELEAKYPNFIKIS